MVRFDPDFLFAGNTARELKCFRLRWTTTQEWHDIYQQENINDLHRFFDKYMLGKANGWENTPKVRYSLLGYNRPSVVNRPAKEYPPANFSYVTLFLDATTASLGHHKPLEDSVAEYQADSDSETGCHFVHKFDCYTEMSGISKAKVYMSTNDHDDMVNICFPASESLSEETLQLTSGL